MSNPLYPDINVSLVGEDGNAFSIMGRVSKAMKRAKVPATAIKEFTDQAMSGDYDNLLRTCMAYVSVDGDSNEDQDDDWDDDDDDDDECYECGEWIDDCTCDEEEDD